MITIHSELDIVSSYPLQSPYSLEDIIFFDIETTGFSANTSYLYLIGCMYYKEKVWQITQWLADDMDSEAAILEAFFHKLESYKRLVHFNGSGFDIPFILQKCRQHNMKNPFQGIDSMDIYKKLLPYKRLLPLTNYKLKTIEKFLNVERKDSYSGGELIQIYANYLGRIQYEKLHQKVLSNQKSIQNIQTNSQSNKNIPVESAPSSEELSRILLLHNLEDVKGLLQVADILYYTDIFEKDLSPSNSIENDSLNIDAARNEWVLNFTCSYTFPHSITWETPLTGTSSLLFSAKQNQLTLQIPMYKGELKYFHPNYKDYYYLPKEDMAIHISVAQYVDKAYRMKARASNCYTRTSGNYLPQPVEIISPSFKIEYSDKISYIELTNSLLIQPSILYEYKKALIHFILTNKETKICYES